MGNHFVILSWLMEEKLSADVIISEAKSFEN
jgi:hypothetical protein